jgi:hypothetical protein
MARQSRRFTIYDAMEDAGVFERNPANIDSRNAEKASIYVRADYPKMLYHPEGKERVTVPAVAEATPFGPQWMGEQREIINRIVGDPEEEKHWKGLGWHEHPAYALQAAGKEMPELSSDSRVRELQDKIRAMEAELAKHDSASKALAAAKHK